MNEHDKHFLSYWTEMEKRGKRYFILRNIKVLLFTVIPIMVLVNLAQNSFSGTYLLSGTFLFTLVLLTGWCFAFGYGFSIFTWKNNQKRFEKLNQEI
jgi:hypothetical protein